MSNFIPFIIELYPDELLYSWIIRLAKANEMPIQLFYELYFDKSYKNSQIPIDVRRGFLNLYNSLNSKDSPIDLYLKTSTLQFELLAYSPKNQVRYINNVFRNENRLNLQRGFFITDIHMCKECIKEDIEQFGEPYIHRSHQLSGVCVCHKHHTSLFSQKPDNKCSYTYEEMDEMSCSNSHQKECDYADYAHALLEQGVKSNSNDIVNLIVDKIGLNGLSKKELAIKINKI